MFLVILPTMLTPSCIFRFIQNMTARVISKMACWSAEPMQGQDLQHFLLWLKDQLKMQVSSAEGA